VYLTFPHDAVFARTRPNLIYVKVISPANTIENQASRQDFRTQRNVDFLRSGNSFRRSRSLDLQLTKILVPSVAGCTNCRNEYVRLHTLICYAGSISHWNRPHRILCV